MIYGNAWGPSFCTPSYGYSSFGGGYGCSMYNSCCSYSGGFASPGWNPWGSMIGGARGSMVGSAIGGVLGFGLGALGGGFWGAALGGSIGSMFGSSLGYLGGSLAGGFRNPFGCW